MNEIDVNLLDKKSVTHEDVILMINILHTKFFYLKKTVLAGCILKPFYYAKFSKELSFKNPITKTIIHIPISECELVSDITEIYIPEKITQYYQNSKRANTIECGVDKFGTEVYVDSLVVYYDQNLNKNDALRFGYVVSISKTNNIVVRDALTSNEIKLTNSKRYLVIDSDIETKLMILKLSL